MLSFLAYVFFFFNAIGVGRQTFPSIARGVRRWKVLAGVDIMTGFLATVCGALHVLLFARFVIVLLPWKEQKKELKLPHCLLKTVC